MRKTWMWAGAAVLAACGSDAIGALVADGGELVADAGEALRDAGEWLADAGGAVSDAGAHVGDAQAQVGAAETYDVQCDELFERVVTSASSTQTQAYWFATVQTDTSDITGVDAVLCGLQTFNSTAPFCPDDATCTGTTAPPSPDCVVQSGAQLPNGLVRVSCGYRARTNYTDPSLPDLDIGERRRTARITVRR